MLQHYALGSKPLEQHQAEQMTPSLNLFHFLRPMSMQSGRHPNRQLMSQEHIVPLLKLRQKTKAVCLWHFENSLLAVQWGAHKRR